MGQEFRSNLVGGFWFGVFHRLQLYKDWTEAGRPVTKMAQSSGSGQEASFIRFENLSMGLLECPHVHGSWVPPE